jgi:hypothetical protein
MSDPLPLIRRLYRQHASRPEITASFLADQAMAAMHITDDPAHAAQHERYRVAAAGWLTRKFGPGRMRRR